MGHAKRVSGRILGERLICAVRQFLLWSCGATKAAGRPPLCERPTGQWWRWAESNRRPEPGSSPKTSDVHVLPRAFVVTCLHPTLSIPGHPHSKCTFMCTYEDYSTHMCTMQAGIVQYHDVGVRATQSSAWATASAIEAAAKAYPAARSWPPPPCGATMARTLVVAPAQVRQLLR